MKKLVKRDYINLSCLIGFVLLFIFVLFLTGHLFISNIDYLNQHMIYPDYFRKLFYNTGSFFPSFAFNLGMGENIYYFSYYGLLSPILILSYILPFIPMHVYIPLISFISLIASIIIFYRWINTKYDSNVALITTILFLLNATFFYHFHRHIMFVIYMPFLLLALHGVDLFFKKNKVLPLVIFTLLVILTNYYFGAYSCIFIALYAIYSLLKNKKFEFRKFFKVIYLEIIAVMISAVLLLPTLYALLNGRIDTTVTSLFSSIDLFRISKNFDYTFYASYYSWGLIFIYIVALIHGFKSKKKANIFLSAILALTIIFPIFSYVLNGFMYIDGKCYLPFLPIALLLISDFVVDFLNNKYEFKDNKVILIIVSAILIVAAIGSNLLVLLVLDIILTFVFLNKKIKNPYLNFIPVLVIALASFIISSCNEQYLKVSDYKKLNSNSYNLISEVNNNYRMGILNNKLYTVNRIYNISNNRTTVYSSLVNKNYFKQFRNVFDNEILNRDNYVLSEPTNIIFDIYTGTRYLISTESCPFGYSLIKGVNDLILCENSDALSISYATSKVMSLKEFKALKYPYNLDALLHYAIVDKDIDDTYESHITKYDLQYEVIDKENIKYRKVDNHYLIEASKGNKISLKINDDLTNKILFIKFKMNKAKEGFACSSGITINGSTNALSCDKWKYNNGNTTFEYVLSNTNILDITFTNDSFDLSDFEFYTMDYDVVKDIKNNINEATIELISDNNLKIKVSLEEKGILKTTIPYEEKGFSVLVDNKKAEIIKVDDTYIGLELNKGQHEISITFNAPYLLIGKIITFIGVLLLIYEVYPYRIKFKKLFKKGR